MDNKLRHYAEVFRQAVSNSELEQAFPAADAVKANWHLGRIGLESFMAIVSAERFELLKALRRLGPVSVGELALALNRGERSVDTDASILIGSGLIDRTESGLVEVTWDQVTAKLDLLAA